MIKHLGPKTRNEVQNSILNLPASLEKIKLLNENYIEVTEEEANEIFNNLSVNEKIQLGIKRNRPEIVRKAIKDIELPFRDSQPIINWAVQHKHYEIKDSLIKKLNSKEKILIGTSINDKNLIEEEINRESPVWETLYFTEWEFRSIIEWAILNNHRDIVRNLFLHDVKTKAKNVNSIKSEYLTSVISFGDTELVKILLDAGVDIHIDMDMPLIQACNLQNVEIVKLLLKDGADINAQNGIALRSVCIGGKIEIVKMLLKLGADVHAENDEALRIAAANGHTEIVKLLLEKGADASAHNYLALYWAELNGNEEIINILKDEQERLNKA